MLLKIIMFVFLIFLVFLALYLLAHRESQFIGIDISNNQPLRQLITRSACLLLITAIGGGIIVISLTKPYYFIPLFISVATVFYLALGITKQIK